MSQRAKSPESGFGFFNHFRRTISYGLFGATLLGVPTFLEASKPRETIEFNVGGPEVAEKDKIVRPADSIDYSFSMSIDCLLSFGGAKQTDKLGLSNEMRMPLDMGVKKGGGLSDIFLVGQRAPGKQEGEQITSGWGVVYDSDKKQYHIFNLSTEDRIPADGQSGGLSREPVPHLVASPAGTLGIEDLMNEVRWAFGGMQFSMQHEAGNPYGPLRFSLTGTATT